MCIEPRPPVRNTGHGFTLVELVIIIVVLAAGLVGIFTVYNQTIARSADPMLQQQALAIAEGYMEEILGLPCDAGAPTGLVRGERQTAHDYDGDDDAPPLDIAGQAMAELGDYRAAVDVSDTTLAGVPGCEVRVTVTNTRDAGVRTTLTGFIADAN